jgi:hypothetical protein
MGDRVLFQVVRSFDWTITSAPQAHISPVVYGHWAAAYAPAICAKLAARMASRGDDLDYTAARLVQEVCATAPDGALSVGLWNASDILKADDSHGDGGCVIIEVSSKGMRFKCVGGYLRASEDGKTVIDPNATKEG